MSKLLRWSAVHLPHALLLPVLGLTAFTFAHELAHGGVALAQGARVTEFAFLPTADRLGHMRYEVPPDARFFSGDLVSAAPYVLWTCSALTVAAISALPRQRLHPALASTLFVWGYAVPVGDILANMGRGDLFLPGVEGLLLTGAVAALVTALWGLAYPVQRRLYGEIALDLPVFIGISAVLFGAAVLLGL